MPQHTDFVNEFLEQAKGNPLGLRNDSALVKRQIAFNERRASDTEQAFAALQQSQQPTTFDKVGDIGLALAAIADLSTGPKRRRGQAGEKFRGLKADRDARKQAKEDKRFNKFLRKMKLDEFLGDTANRNFNLERGLTQQQNQQLLGTIKTLIEADRAKSERELRKAQTGAITKKAEGPTKEDRDNANKLELLKQAKDIRTEATKRAGPQRIDGGETDEQYQLRIDFYRDQITREINAILNPRRPGPTGGLEQPQRSLADFPPQQGIIPQSQVPVEEPGGFFNTLSTGLGSIKPSFEEILRRLTGGK